MKNIITLESGFRTFFCLFVILLSVPLIADNVMILPDVTGDPSENIIVNIEVNNDDIFVAFQLDIPLPSGFDYVNESISLNEARMDDHLISAQKLPGTDILRIVTISITGAPFKGNSGPVCSFELTTPNVPGAYFLEIEDAIISDPDATNIITGSQGGYIKLGDVYIVTFDVEDEIGNPVNDAIITLDGVTNPAGLYEFYAIDGTHPYSVVKKYYNTVTGNAIVAGSDLLVPVTLSLAPTYSVTFIVTNKNNSEPIEGALITLKDVDDVIYQGLTPANGTYEFSGLIAGNYTYTVVAEGFGVINGSLQLIDQNLIQNVEMSNTFSLTLVDNPAGAAAVLIGSGNYVVGSQVTVRIVAWPAYVFENWTIDGEIISTQSQFKYTMPAEDVTIVANFYKRTVNLTLEINKPFYGSVTGAGQYFYGDTVTVTATPSSPSCSFVSWNEGSLVRSTDPVWTFALTAHRTYTAIFTAESSYDVVFDVKDKNGQSISDAIVTLFGIANAPGNYQFNDVPPGTFTYTVTADNYKTYTGQITMVDEDLEVEVVLQDLVPEFNIFPESKDFGMVLVNSQSDPQLFVVKNIAEGILNITNVELRLQDIDQFIIVDANSYPVALTVNDSLVFEIIFAPTSIGYKTAILTITDALSRVMHDVTLTGTGYLTAQSLPFEEDFTDIEPDEIPESWMRSSMNWGVMKTDNAGGSSPEMVFNSEPEDRGVFKLITPPIYFEDESLINLYFKTMVKDLANTPGSYSLSVETSANYGQTWISHWNEQPYENIPAKIIEIDLSSLSGNTIILAWVFEGNTADISSWFIDDILICYVPYNRIISNETISGQACFDAVNSIGISNVTINSDGEADFISGEGIIIQPSVPGFVVEPEGSVRFHVLQNIVFQSNTKIKAGAYMKAEIAALPYCCQPTPLMTARNDEELIDSEVIVEDRFFSSSLRAFPNPTSGRLTIYFDEAAEQNTYLEIYNMIGNLILTSHLNGIKHFEIDIRSIPNGIYLLRILSETESATMKIIKE
ncbi:MAG: carboxypeptidase regulatory-like domain-containing protein [Bacteroidales bacterium]